MQYYQAMMKQPLKAMKQRKIDIDSDALDLIVRMWAVNPEERPTMSEIKTHKWFSQGVASDIELKKYFSYVQKNFQNTENNVN